MVVEYLTRVTCWPPSNGRYQHLLAQGKGFAKLGLNLKVSTVGESIRVET